MGCGQTKQNVQEPRDKKENIYVAKYELGVSTLNILPYDQLAQDYNYKKLETKDSTNIVVKVVYIPKNEERGIKTIKKSKVILEAHIKKYQMLKSFSHPNLPQIYDIYEDDEYQYIAMEICREELFDRILSQVCFSENESRIIMKQILVAVDYLHKKNVIHRDIKLEHIMFIQKGSDLQIKLVGFSQAKILSLNQKLTEKVGSPFYVAPEIIKGNYGLKSDEWACGVVLFMLLTGCNLIIFMKTQIDPPFEGDAQDEILQKVEEGALNFQTEEWNDISKEGKEFVSKLLQKNVNLRYTAEQALQDPWMLKSTKK